MITMITITLYDCDYLLTRLRFTVMKLS